MTTIAQGTNYQWEVRKRNTARLSLLYQQKNGTPISLAGATAKLYVRQGDAVILTKDCNILGTNQIDMFLTKAEILAFTFEQAEYELNVTFSNGDEETFAEGALVVRDGRGPFE